MSKIESTSITLTIGQTKKTRTKNILTDEKKYKDLVIYFTIYIHSQSINLY